MSMSDTTTLAFSVPRLPLGKGVESIVDWLNSNLGPLFDGIQTVVSSCVSGLTDALLFVPWPILILLLAGLGWALRTWKFALFAVLGPLVIVSLRQWETAMQTLALVMVAGVIAVLVAVPIGIAAAQSRVISRIVKPVLDLMQTMPAFVYLIPGVTFFGLGTVPGVVATVIFAMPPGVRLTELGIRQVDREVVEAGEAFGASPLKVLSRIKLPLAVGTIMAGINQVVMLSLSMVVIAGMVGADGLGTTVTGAVSQLKIGLGFEGGVAVVILAIYLDRITAALGDRTSMTRRGGRKLLRRTKPVKASAVPAEKPEPSVVGA